jgi:KDO2-lipid IV(A) lauroyltransferase
MSTTGAVGDASRPGEVGRAGDAHGTIGQRVRARLIVAAAALACRLPERLLIELADVAGWVWYRADARRAALGRRNLRRICEWCATEGRGTARARAAAADPAILESLLRSAFRHQARYYVELARISLMTPAYVRERLEVETPEVVDHAFAVPGPLLIVGLHFGSLELPAVFFVDRAQRRGTVPMETIEDPVLQRWFARARESVGIRVVGLREARRELLAALGRGDPVGIVADRDLTGGGIEVPLFGHPAPLPVGPALIALEGDARVYVAAIRRSGPGRYRARVEHIELPEGASRRERVTGFLRAEAAAFERLIEVAPEQWWAMFHPLWRDLKDPVDPVPAEPAERVPAEPAEPAPAEPVR